jgi:hypothetical protein
VRCASLEHTLDHHLLFTFMMGSKSVPKNAMPV